MKSSKLIAVAIAVLGLTWILSGVIFPPAQSQPAAGIAAQDQTDKPVDVRVRDLSAEEHQDYIVVTGRSRAIRSVDLKAETSGQVVRVLKEEGQSVAKGDVLVKLEVKDRAARMREARERVEQRQIEYNAAQELERRGFNSQVRLSQALADLEDAKAQLELAKTELSKVDIKAPYDGVVTSQMIELGDFLNVGDTVFTIVDLSPIEFVGYVSERRIADVQDNAKVRVSFLEGGEIDGVLSYVAPAANTQTRTFEIVVTAPNADFAIKEGLTATMSVVGAQKKAHKISPSILSLNDAGQVGVKLVNRANKVEFHPVKILADEPKAMWVSGLPELARVITVGQDFVIEGQQVNPVPSQGEGLL